MSVPGPTLGPCTSWIDGSDITCPQAASLDDAAKDMVAFEASMALFEISGRQFSGLCERLVRPCSTRCSCWGGDALGFTPWTWSSYWPYGIGWWDETGERHIGCQPIQRVRLYGYPVREITEIKIGGEVLPPQDDDGNPNYRLDKWRDLVRMDSPTDPVTQNFWPACQNMSLTDDQPGTFSVAYLSGVDPPQLGRDAAAVLACQLAAQLGGGGDCKLPDGVTKLTRQGVEIERSLLANWFDPTKATGLVPVDLFLKAYWPGRTGRRPAVFSPDVQRFARPEGSF